MPLKEPFDIRSSPHVVWEGTVKEVILRLFFKKELFFTCDPLGPPLCINNLPYHDALHSNEQNIASTLRLTPEQYIQCKWR
ncbi:hypothetical protein BC941DRAFT_163587 [Chlamydoabsidia padenii]|nr:hypothetical protein BC941DRAFT_163587 [Chlamydoabsidia padenii]